MADYRTIDAIPDPEYRAIAQRTSAFLQKLDKVYALPPSTFEQIRTAFANGKNKEGALLLVKHAGMPVEAVAGFMGGTAEDSGAMDVAKDALSAVPGYGLISSAAGAIAGGAGAAGGLLSVPGSLIKDLFSRPDSERVRFSPRQADEAAAIYAGALYDRTRGEPSVMDKASAGIQYAQNQLMGSSVGIFLQAALIKAGEWVKGLFNAETPQRSFEEIQASLQQAYGPAAERSYDDLVRDAQRARAMPEAKKVLVESGKVSPSVGDAINGEAAVRDRATGKEVVPVSPVVAPVQGSATQVPAVSGTPYAREQSATVQSAAAVKNGVAGVVSGGAGFAGGVLGTAASIPLAPAQFAVNRANAALTDAQDGNLVFAGVNGVVAAKAAQVTATGFRIPFTQTYVPGVVQVLAWAGDKVASGAGKALEAAGHIPDARADAQGRAALDAAKATAAETARASALASGAGELEASRAARVARADVGRAFDGAVAARAADTNALEKTGNWVQRQSAALSGAVTGFADKVRDFSFFRAAKDGVKTIAQKTGDGVAAVVSGTGTASVAQAADGLVAAAGHQAAGAAEVAAKGASVLGRVARVGGVLGRAVPVVGVGVTAYLMLASDDAHAKEYDGQSLSPWDKLTEDHKRGRVTDAEFTAVRGLQSGYVGSGLGGVFTAAGVEGSLYANGQISERYTRYFPASLVDELNGLYKDMTGAPQPAAAHAAKPATPDMPRLADSVTGGVEVSAASRPNAPIAMGNATAALGAVTVGAA